MPSWLVEARLSHSAPSLATRPSLEDHHSIQGPSALSSQIPCSSFHPSAPSLRGALPTYHSPCPKLPTSMLLAIYSPRRQLVELWMARQGIRLLALAQVGAHCQLLQTHGNGIVPSMEVGALEGQVDGKIGGFHASPSKVANDVQWNNNDWDFDEADEVEGSTVGPDAEIKYIPKDGDHEELLKYGLASCFLFDGARGFITDLCGSLDRAVRAQTAGGQDRVSGSENGLLRKCLK